ncbi:MAG: bifunctional serine/threonine-protein kinase/formylglycine-generating enzyme family protein [Planctomycetota bacterium]
MDLDRQRRIRDLFLESLEQPSDARIEWLQGRCGEDTELFDDVAALLGDEDGSFLESPIVAKDPKDLIGTDVGGHELLDVLGAGGMGIVYCARQSDPERDVALKLLRHFAGTEGEKRFLREIATTTRLDHPGIVRVIRSGVDGELRWYTMDLVDGWPLDELLKRSRVDGGLPEDAPDLRNHRACADLVRQLADALEYAHRQGVIHRDVKPANVLVDREGRARLADFGLARNFEVTGMSGTEQIAGTLAFMSPEQARALRDAADPRSDIYSAGAVLYALLSGRPPHEGSTGAELLARVLYDRPTPLRRAAPNVDRGLAAICDAALRYDPRARYESAGAMREDLQRWLRGERVLGRPLGPGERIRSLRLDRRTLVRAVPVAAAGGALGLYGAVQIARAARSDRVDVTIDLGDADRGAILVLQEADGFGGVGPPERMGTYEKPGQRLRVRPGRGRLSAVVGDRWVSFDRVFRGGEDLEGRCTGVSAGESWARVAAGTTAVVRGPESGRSADGAPNDSEVTLEAFWITRARVTHGEYESTLRRAGRWNEEGVERRLLDEASAPKRTDWKSLPATLVTFLQARRFAEMKGCRLPTTGEWQLAVIRDSSGWPPSLPDTGRVVGRFEQGVPFEDQSSIDGYVRHVRPAGDPAYATGALRIFHPLGNVNEWTSSPAPFTAAMNGAASNSLTVTQRGPAWFESLDLTIPVSRVALGFSLASKPHWSTGFRCAKAESPPPTRE